MSPVTASSPKMLLLTLILNTQYPRVLPHISVCTAVLRTITVYSRPCTVSPAFNRGQQEWVARMEALRPVAAPALAPLGTRAHWAWPALQGAATRPPRGTLAGVRRICAQHEVGTPQILCSSDVCQEDFPCISRFMAHRIYTEQNQFYDRMSHPCLSSLR